MWEPDRTELGDAILQICFLGPLGPWAKKDGKFTLKTTLHFVSTALFLSNKALRISLLKDPAGINEMVLSEVYFK